MRCGGRSSIRLGRRFGRRLLGFGGIFRGVVCRGRPGRGRLRGRIWLVGGLIRGFLGRRDRRGGGIRRGTRSLAWQVLSGGVQLTMRDRTAMSRRPSIQKAQEAIHRFPSAAASGNTLVSRISFKTGPSSPSYARVMAMAS